MTEKTVLGPELCVPSFRAVCRFKVFHLFTFPVYISIISVCVTFSISGNILEIFLRSGRGAPLQRTQSAVHQDNHFQHAAEILFQIFIFPDKHALPAGMLAEEDLQLKGGLLSPALPV